MMAWWQNCESFAGGEGNAPIGRGMRLSMLTLER